MRPNSWDEKYDLCGRVFGRLTVMERAVNAVMPNGRNCVRWKCICQCGKEHTTLASALLRGSTKSCGCARHKTGYSKLAPKLIGQKFGRLTVVERIEPRKAANGANLYLWQCVCSCGKTVERRRKNLNQNSSCGCYTTERNKNNAFLGFGGISGGYISPIIHRCKRLNREYAVSTEYLWNLFLSQGRRCALSGIELTFDPESSNKYKKDWKKQTASLDRIDSNQGYTEGNVRWVHKDLNKMRMDMSDEEFIGWCKLIVDHKSHTQEE